MQIDILLRTHDRSNVHPIVRTISTDKAEIVLRSAWSLVQTINQCQHNCHLTVIDDHSTDTTKKELEKILKNCHATTDWFDLTESGNNASMLEWFERARTSTADLVYCIEDDYIHVPEALDTMITAYELFRERLQTEVVIHPLDDPHAYRPEFITPCRVVLGPTMHWRTLDVSACPMLANPELIRQNWPSFERMARLYGTIEGNQQNIHEGTTISEIYQQGKAFLFIPLKPLAIHLNEWPQHFFASHELWEANRWDQPSD